MPTTRTPRPRDTVGLTLKRAGSLHGVKSVGSFLPRLTRKAFEKYGFCAANLITDWAAIAGKELAAHTAPERLKWARGPEASEDDAAPGEKRQRGATLLLRVDGARALDVQYNARQIIERINAYFGYAAVAELRIVQAPVPQAAQRQSLPRPAAPPPLTQEVAHIPDGALRDALARLGAGIRAGR